MPARVRSARPHWRGGGVALGPKPRSYAQRTPKKMVRLALRSALSDRAADGKVVVLDDWGIEAPKHQGRAARRSTRSASTGRVARGAAATTTRPCGRASATCRRCTACYARELNAYDVLVADYVIFTKDTLPAARASTVARDHEQPSARRAPSRSTSGATTEPTMR